CASAVAAGRAAAADGVAARPPEPGARSGADRIRLVGWGGCGARLLRRTGEGRRTEDGRGAVVAISRAHGAAWLVCAWIFRLIHVRGTALPQHFLFPARRLAARGAGAACR